jgi:hypothetical protein
MPTVKTVVYSFCVGHAGYYYSASALNPYDQIMIKVGDKTFESDARHLKGWCEKNGFTYYSGIDTCWVNVV